MEFNLTNFLIGIFGGGTIATIIVAIINKIKDKGDKRKEWAAFMQMMTDNFDKIEKTLENAYSTALGTMQKAIDAANENFSTSAEREKQLSAIIETTRDHSDRIERKLDQSREESSRKSQIINKAYKCRYIKGKNSVKECVVLAARVEYEGVCQDCDECSADEPNKEEIKKKRRPRKNKVNQEDSQ